MDMGPEDSTAMTQMKEVSLTVSPHSHSSLVPQRAQERYTVMQMRMRVLKLLG